MIPIIQEHTIIFAVIFGFLLDLCFGDPRWLYHPVRLIGKYIEVSEKFYRRLFHCEITKSAQNTEREQEAEYDPKAERDSKAEHDSKAERYTNAERDPKAERTAGICTAITVMLISTILPLVLLQLLYKIHFLLGFVLEVFWCYQILATRSLRDESMKVYRALQTGDIQKSRYAVSMIVGRDTEQLDEQGVTKACVETIAENASDGIIAPLVFLMIGGAAGGFFYKSVNTMDSMIGYKNDRYRYFGTFAAKLDDVLNFIPARLGGILMVLAAFCSGFDGKNAWKIFRRDRLKHASPNSAHTEAAAAGALRIRLAGDAWYFGKLHKKDYLGDALREIQIQDIVRMNRLMYVTAILSLLLTVFIRFILEVFI